jgi:hypothetical protein
VLAHISARSATSALTSSIPGQPQLAECNVSTVSCAVVDLVLWVLPSCCCTLVVNL